MSSAAVALYLNISPRLDLFISLQFSQHQYRFDSKLQRPIFVLGFVSELLQPNRASAIKCQNEMIFGDPFLGHCGKWNANWHAACVCVPCAVCASSHLNDNIRISHTKWIINRFIHSLSPGKCLRWLNFYSIHDSGMSICESDLLSNDALIGFSENPNAVWQMQMNCCRSAFWMCARGEAASYRFAELFSQPVSNLAFAFSHICHWNGSKRNRPTDGARHGAFTSANGTRCMNVNMCNVHKNSCARVRTTNARRHFIHSPVSTTAAVNAATDESILKTIASTKRGNRIFFGMQFLRFLRRSLLKSDVLLVTAVGSHLRQRILCNCNFGFAQERECMPFYLCEIKRDGTCGSLVLLLAHSRTCERGGNALMRVASCECITPFSLKQMNF